MRHSGEDPRCGHRRTRRAHAAVQHVCCQASGAESGSAPADSSEAEPGPVHGAPVGAGNCKVDAAPQEFVLFDLFEDGQSSDGHVEDVVTQIEVLRRAVGHLQCVVQQLQVHQQHIEEDLIGFKADVMVHNTGEQQQRMQQHAPMCTDACVITQAGDQAAGPECAVDGLPGAVQMQLEVRVSGAVAGFEGTVWAEDSGI